MADTTPSPKNKNGDTDDFWLGETISLLALSLLDGIGYWTLHNLALAGLGFKQVLKVDSVSKFIDYLLQIRCKNINKITNQVGEDWLSFREQLWQRAIQLYRQLQAEGVKVIHFDQELFPQSLREIADPPKWLFVQGDVSVLHQRSLTIVGTRNPSEDGIFLANYIGSCLPYFDAVTVSGLAIGIDQIIHKKSIKAKVPTIAFIGTGILQNYPAGSEKLRQTICEKGGAIVSEYLPHQSYSAENFVHRNRLQAGLADIVIPVEWKIKGGTAHTVQFASKANKLIICLKLPEWFEPRSELLLAKKLGAQIFTIPGEEEKFLRLIKNFFSNKKINSIVYESKNNLANNHSDFSEEANPYKQLPLFDTNQFKG